MSETERSGERATGSNPGGEPPPDRPSWSQRRRRAARPVLASEALRDDVAPLEPGRVAARWFCAGYAMLLVAFGTEALRHDPAGWLRWGPSYALALVAAVAAALPVRYAERARAMVVIGALAAFVGIGGGALHQDGPWDAVRGVMRLLAGSLLPATLLFRAHYRAYVGARWLLAAGLSAALPAAGLDVLAIVQAQTFGPMEVAAAVLPLVVLASSVGFMGAQTTAAGNALGPTVVAALAAEVFLSSVRAWDVRGLLHAALPAVAYAAAAGTLAVGLSQLLAHRFSADARKLDVLQGSFREEEDDDEPPPSDWSGRA